MRTSTRPRCSRGVLLRAHQHEVSRAAQYVGTMGMSGAGKLIIEESRGRIVRLLLDRWGHLLMGHLTLVMKIFATVEVRELYQ